MFGTRHVTDRGGLFQRERLGGGARDDPGPGEVVRRLSFKVAPLPRLKPPGRAVAPPVRGVGRGPHPITGAATDPSYAPLSVKEGGGRVGGVCGGRGKRPAKF